MRITARDIKKSYNGGLTPVLNGVSLDIDDGGLVVILGASGSGKSTLLTVLSGLERPDSGAVDCGGFELTSMTDKQLTELRRKKVGFVFQQYYLLSHLTVEKNIKLGAALAGKTDIAAVAEAVGLKDKLSKRPAELSGGEQQRVCIARAVAKEPEIMFLDEPTGALDEQTGRGVLDWLARLRAERGFTAVMVTHNANIADMADTVVRINSGRITEVTKNAAPKSAFEIGW